MVDYLQPNDSMKLEMILECKENSLVKVGCWCCWSCSCRLTYLLRLQWLKARGELVAFLQRHLDMVH